MLCGDMDQINRAPALHIFKLLVTSLILGLGMENGLDACLHVSIGLNVRICVYVYIIIQGYKCVKADITFHVLAQHNCLLEGVDYMDHGLQENGQEIILKADNAEQCQIKCQETSYCVGITFVHQWKKCHLKHIIPGSSFDTKNIGTVSGPKYCGNTRYISY